MNSKMPQAPQPAQDRCKICDGTGDAVGFDGEWLGACKFCDANRTSQVKEPPVSLTSDEVSALEFLREYRKSLPASLQKAGIGAVIATLAARQPAVLTQPAAEADERELFEQWAKKEGLIQESFGVRSVNSMCDVAKLAWQARAALAQSPARQELQIVRDHNAEKIARIIEEVVDCGGFDVRDQREALILEEVCIAVVRRLCIERQPDIKAMVDRFLGWKLPDYFCPDCYIRFYSVDAQQNGSWPIGANLLTADQAKAMFEYCLAAPQQGATK